MCHEPHLQIIAQMLCASFMFNFTLSVRMDITNDFSQPNGCDIIIGRGRTGDRAMPGIDSFLDHTRPVISPTYIRRLLG
jgi:hypothetical protein